MAFSFASVAAEVGGAGSPSQGVQVQDGPELQEITTGQLGFMTLNGETKIKLLSEPWPAENPPIPSAQLLSVASSQGLLAAASPNALEIFLTDEIRKILQQREGEDVREVRPLISIPHSRLAHVAFSSDDSVLVVSEEAGGVVTAYQVDSIKAGRSQAALQISTDGVGLRALIPNPNPQSAHLFAAINANGELFLVDLSTGQLANGTDGAVLKRGVSCLSWSNRGKQLVAGSADGTATQMKPNGSPTAHIPKSTTIPGDVHVSSLIWLEDDSFFIIYTPDTTSTEEGVPPSEYYVVDRQNKTNYTFHKMPEILPPFGVERLPTYHFTSRLRRFDPHISDLVILSATTATDIGIISKTSQPLSPQDPVVNSFTLTAVDDDSRRAQLPIASGSSLDTSPIGMVVDLSSTQSVINPIPSNPEIQETTGPVPNLLVLNNEGTLSSWWIIYNDSVTEKTTYSGFDSLSRLAQIRSAASPPAETMASPPSTESQSTFAQPAAPKPSPFAAPSLTNTTSSSPFGAFTNQSAFSSPKSQPQASANSFTNASFGTTTKIGDNKSSWTSTGFGGNTTTSPATGSAFGQVGFGQPAFGTSSTVNNSAGPAFGSASALGGKPSPFGQPASPAPAFGQRGFGSTSAASPFATVGGSTTGSGFSSFAGSGGFGSASNKSDESKQNPFTKPATSSGFGMAAKSESPFSKLSSNSGVGSAFVSDSPFANTSSSSAFGSAGKWAPSVVSKKPDETPEGSLGGKSLFKLESSFKGDGSAKDDLPAPAAGSSLGFGSGFGNLLGEAKKDVSPTSSAETDMGDGDDDSELEENTKSFNGFSPDVKKNNEDAPKSFITPPSTITQPKTTPAPPLSNLFGAPQQQSTTPQQAFGGHFPFTSTTPKETPTAAKTLFGTNPVTVPTPAQVEKSEPVKSFDKVPEFQTPDSKDKPKSRSDANAPQITTESPSDDEAVDLKDSSEPPLPPDPISKPGYATGDTSASSLHSKEPDDAPLPPAFVPANKSAATQDEGVELPADDEHGSEELSSDFADSGEEVTQYISPVEDHEDDSTDNIQSSPESSFKGGDTSSPTGGLFTKISTNEPSRISRPLFGEVGRSAPVFPPPAIQPNLQQSPRSPSPVRKLMPHDSLRNDTRSVSAPVQHRSAIDQRKAEYSQSAIAVQAARAREEEALREKARLDAIRSANEQAKANELQSLVDDEDQRLQEELAQPVQPSETLGAFITYESGSLVEHAKADISAQIERLYRDINSMIINLGINAKSLSSFILYQTSHEVDNSWPNVLTSETPLDALNDEWFLDDINRLYEGSKVLESSLGDNQVKGVPQKLEKCQDLLTRDLFDLRTKVTSIRKSLHARAISASATMPLSAEQASIQHDLRKASASVQTNLVQIEDSLAVMRARLAEASPPESTNRRQSMVSGQAVQKRPTVEAVTNTVSKMTAMAEKKSADVDVLEAQLRKLDTSLGVATLSNGSNIELSTPHRFGKSPHDGTPGSTTSSVFYTPDSKVGGSSKSSRSERGNLTSMAIFSADDRGRWQAKARRKKEIASVLRKVLEDKQEKATTST